MLKYFREIRFNLLGEKRIGKYLKYALGEIVLVVIGILIALQINNWNQLKQHKSDLANHLNTVVENLKDDKTQLENLIEYRENSFLTSSNMLKKYKKREISNPTEFIDAMMIVIREKRFDRHSSGFERLENTELYQSEDLLELRRLIAEYDKIIEQITFWELRYNTFTESMETELANRGFNHETMNFWLNYLESKPNQIAQTDSDFQSSMDIYPSISQLFLRTVFTNHDVMVSYKQLIEKGKEIENEITVYLSQN